MVLGGSGDQSLRGNMGWAVVAGIFRLYQTIHWKSLFFLIAGGIAYTLGTIWYRKLNRWDAHVICHVFVLAGAILRWWGVWFLS
jgi:hemolysin III